MARGGNDVKVLKQLSFKGDIIITDPQYIMRQYTTPQPERCFYPDDAAYKTAMLDWEFSHPDHWALTNFGTNLELIGLTRWLNQDTYYGAGQYSCFDATDNRIGRFCTDSGIIGVYKKREVENYNPDWKDYITSPYKCTYIPKFNGIIYTVNFNDGDDVYSDIRIIGRGNMNFYTKQTGV